jgi:hypothetical protein
LPSAKSNLGNDDIRGGTTEERAMAQRAPGGPEREALAAVRRHFFRLHKTLIDAERIVFERTQGRSMGSGEFLQALIQDPFFEWLRPFSRLLVEMDEALASREPLPEGAAAAFLRRIDALTGSEASAAEERYALVSGREPEVLLAHVELRAALKAAMP